MAFDDINFNTAMRGYNREEVDEVIRSLRTQLAQAGNQDSVVSREIAAMRTRIKQLET